MKIRFNTHTEFRTDNSLFEYTNGRTGLETLKKYFTIYLASPEPSNHTTVLTIEQLLSEILRRHSKMNELWGSNPLRQILQLPR